MIKPFIQRIHPKLLKASLIDLGVDWQGIQIIEKKSHDFVFKLFALPLSAMHILKQEALSVGADLATPRAAILCQDSSYDAILLGNLSQLMRVCQKCLIQPFGLKQIAQTLRQHLLAPAPKSPQLMAIINLTPDSFFQGSRFCIQDAFQTIQTYLQLGVQIIDIGGASSRPQSDLLSPKEELSRLKDLIVMLFEKGLHEQATFSIDTYNPEVADFALSHGFKILNDILGFSNQEMLEVCSKHQAQAILMHSKGTPKTMQSLTHYTHLFAEIDHFFEEKINELRQHHISDIILDIGFGFAKEKEHNLSLIQNLIHFRHFGLPLLVGASRKNTLGLLTNQPIEKRLSATLAIHQIALQNGAEILRAHDIREHLDMIIIHQAMEQLWKS